MQGRQRALAQLIDAWRRGAPGRFPTAGHPLELACRPLQTASDGAPEPTPADGPGDRGPQRILSLSSYVSGGLDAALAQAGGSSRAIRRRGQELTERLKHLSRSRARGGELELQPAEDSALLQAQPKARGWKATARAIRRSGLMRAEAGFEEALDEQWGAAAAAADPGKAGRVRYGSGEAVGYAAARLPACHAVATHVLRELAARDAAFTPRSLLDFGAGPGTAVWAAADVWGGRLETAHAVEPSGAMRWLGLQIEAQLHLEQQAAAGGVGVGGSAPGLSVRWLQHLQGFSSRRAPGRKGRAAWVQSTGGRRYDLVIASYSLGELQPPDRRRALRALWEACDGALVLIEPGTPAGSALVRAARSQVLQWAGGGAHVLAPCPHDGACPMDGGRSWCHFAQRFERGPGQRLAKLRPGKRAPAGHQDERFSYVVLVRGARPQTPPPPPRELAGLRALLARERPAQARGAAAAAAADAAVEALVRQSLAGEDSDPEEWDDSDAAPEAADAPAVAEPDLPAAAAGGGWARVVRPPRKRSGHIIVDVCAASGAGASSGALVRQTVGTRACKRQLGLAGYRALKRLRWGGLWPAPAGNAAV